VEGEFPEYAGGSAEGSTDELPSELDVGEKLGGDSSVGAPDIPAVAAFVGAVWNPIPL
jgi:hypothetical protein